MVKLTSIWLAGWKSIRLTDPPIKINNLNILIGSNGAGKSNLIAYFRMLNAMIEGSLQEFIATSGGMDALLHFGVARTRNIDVGLGFESELGISEYKNRLIPELPVGHVFSEEQLNFMKFGEERFSVASAWMKRDTVLIAARMKDPAGLNSVDVLFQGCRPFHLLDTSPTAPVRRACYVEANRHLAPDAGNLAAMLYLYKQTHPVVYRRILNAVQLVAPYIDSFILEPRRLNPREILLNWKARGSDYEFGPHQISDGTLRFIALTTLLLQPETDLPPLLVLDEPELGLHPAALGILAGMMKQASVHCQILAATQSTSLLDHFDFNDVIVANNRDGTSTFERLNRDDYEAWLEDYSLGNLWERNVIGGGPY